MLPISGFSAGVCSGETCEVYKNKPDFASGPVSKLNRFRMGPCITFSFGSVIGNSDQNNCSILFFTFLHLYNLAKTNLS